MTPKGIIEEADFSNYPNIGAGIQKYETNNEGYEFAELESIVSNLPENDEIDTYIWNTEGIAIECHNKLKKILVK